MRRRVPFAIGWLLVPLALTWLLDELPDASVTPKRLWLAASGVLAALALARAARLTLRTWHLLLGGWLLLELATVPQNLGMALQRVAFTASLWMIALWLEHADLSLRRVRALLAWPVMAVLAGSLFAIFSHENPFFPSELLGSFIGHRNWVSLALVAVLPWFLLSARRSDHVFLLAIAFVLVANRTRTAWLIAIIYVVVLAALSVKRPRLRPALARLAATSVLAIVLVQVLPVRLEWNAPQPYRSSFTSIGEPDTWHGRQDAWRVALEMVRRHPVAGVGTGQFRVAFGEHMLLAHETIIGDPLYPWAMNDYLEAAAERGVLGGALAIALYLVWPLILLWRAAQTRGRRGAVYVLLALPAIGLAVGACGDAPMQRVETVAALVCALVPLQRRLAPIRIEWTGLRARAVAVACALVIGLFVVLRGGNVIATLVYSRDNKPETFETAYRWWPWEHIRDYRPIGMLLDRYLGNQREADAEAFVRASVRNWPDATTTMLAQAVWAKHTGHYDDAVASIRRQLELNAQCDRMTWQMYLTLRGQADFPRALDLPADAVQICAGDWSIPERPEPSDIAWAQAQIYLDEWNGRPLFSASWTGSYRPYQIIDDRVVPVMDKVALDPELQLHSPQPLSDHELVLEVQDGAFNNAYDLGIFDQTANTFTNVTRTPNHNEGSVCVDRARRRIAFRSDETEQVVEPGPRPRVVMSFPRPLIQCVFDEQGRLFGLEDLRTAVHVWRCEIGRQPACQVMPAFEGSPSVGRLSLQGGHVIASVTRAGDEFRSIVRIADDGSLEPVPEVPPLAADILDWDGTAARIDRASRFELVTPGEPDGSDGATIYASRMIAGVRYAIYADAHHIRTIARREGAGWKLLAHGEPAGGALPVEVWLPIDGGKAKVQAFYFGPPDSERVVIWWHGGPLENMSPRFNPYFEALARAGYAVLAVNYPGSSGRGASFERTFEPTALAQTIVAAMAYLADHHARTIVSWSVSTGSELQDVLLDQKIHVSAIVDQAGSAAHQRRRQAAMQGIPYFTIHGEFDANGEETHDFLYPGGHDLLRYRDFEHAMAEVTAFLATAPRCR